MTTEASHPTKTLVFSLLALSLGAPARAQLPSGERAKLRGHVLDRGGQGWKGATVEFRSEAELEIPEAGSRDVVLATSDPKGQFRVKLLRGRRYTAFAWQRDKRGTIRRTRLRRDVTIGREIQLAESKDTSLSLELRVFGLEAWRGRSRRITASVTDEGGNLHTLELSAAGHAKIPPLPGERAELAIAADDVSLTTRAIELESTSRARAMEARRANAGDVEVRDLARGLRPLPREALEDQATECVFVGPPGFLLVRTLADDDEEVDGARIDALESVTGFVRPLAETNEDGMATITLAQPVDEFGRPQDAAVLELQAYCPGFEVAPRRVALGNWLSHSPDSEPYEIRLDPGKRARFRVLDEREEARASAPILVEVRHTVARARRRSVARRLQILRTSRNGVIEIDGLGERAFVSALAYLEAGTEQSPYLKRLPLDVDPTTAHEKRGFVDAPIAGEEWLLHVRDFDGRPARFASIEIVRNASEWYEASLFRERYQCDRRGRVRIRGEHGNIFAISEDAWAQRELERVRRRSKPRLDLRPLTRQKARLSTRDGAPIAGARVRLLRDGGSLPEELRAAVGNLLYSWNMRLLDTTSDSAGRFGLRWISWTGQDLMLHVKLREQTGRVQLRAQIGAEELPLAVDLARPGG